MAALSNRAPTFAPVRDYVPPAVDMRTRQAAPTQLRVSPVAVIVGLLVMLPPLWLVVGHAKEAEAATSLRRTRAQVDLAAARYEALRAQIQDLRSRERVAHWALTHGMVQGQDMAPFVCGLRVSGP